MGQSNGAESVVVGARCLCSARCRKSGSVPDAGVVVRVLGAVDRSLDLAGECRDFLDPCRNLAISAVTILVARSPYPKRDNRIDHDLGKLPLNALVEATVPRAALDHRSRCDRRADAVPAPQGRRTPGCHD